MPAKFYQESLTKFKKQLRQVNKSLYLISMVRLLCFVGIIFSVYYFFNNAKLTLAITVIGAILFVFLVSLYSNVKYRKKKLEALVRINLDELRVLDWDFSFLDPGNEFIDSSHDFSNDLDLFGAGSFFQYLNRTVTISGRKLLSSLVLSNDVENIIDRQEGIKELSEKAGWRQKFSAIASLIKTDVPADVIINWVKEYEPFLIKTKGRIPLVFSLISVIVIGLTIFNIISPFVIVVWLLTGLSITGYHLKRISKILVFTSKAENTFEQYYKLIKSIENVTFNSELLKTGRAHVFTGTGKASKDIRKLSKAIDALDSRNNVFVGFLGNGFFLWDLIQSYRIEKWILKHKNEIDDWFQGVAFFDAYNSLANFAFNHPSYSYPKVVTEESELIVADNLGHPLIKSNNLVPNDFHIDKERFYVITGANMAGKSTFLRSVSLFIMMANIGLPVCASKSTYSPVKLITSMRTTDSLTKEESYFFSELKRLKFITDKIKDANYFIVLDEILKGTNSKDKAEGSKKFVEKLVKSKSSGLVATHDLSLCTIASKNDKVENYFFDAYMKNDEVSFDYKFKKGICKNMNASFLMKKMGIV